MDGWVVYEMGGVLGWVAVSGGVTGLEKLLDGWDWNDDDRITYLLGSREMENRI